MLLPLAIGLSGCGSDSTAVPATNLTITPSLGLVRNATVVVKDAAGTTVGNGSIDSTGTVSIAATGTGPFVIEVQGDADAEYFDENTGIFEPFRAPQMIRAIVPSGTTSVGVTGLTDIAHALWAANGVPLSDANINLANSAVLQWFAPGAPAGMSSILTPPTVLDAALAAGALTSSAGDLYAAILAGLADTGSGATTPALTVIEQLRRDAADGSIDGNEGSTAITGLVYNAGTFAGDFQSAVGALISSFGDTALQAITYSVSTLVVPTWATDGSGGGGGTSNCTNPAASSWFATRGGTYPMAVTSSANELAAEFDGSSGYDIVVDAAGNISVSSDTMDYTFSATEITLVEECALTVGGAPYEAYAIYVDADSGYTALFQNQYENDGFSFSIYEPYTPGASINDLANVYFAPQ